jgi:hypothetical protein
MGNTFIKAEKVVRTALALLEREIVLPTLVWRDAAGNFVGAKDDTISIRLPAYATSRTRALRSSTPYTVDSLAESKVDLTLDTDVYKAVGITDEELTLDIENFGEQVLAPVVRAVAVGCEDAVATAMSDATYEVDLEVDTADPFNTLIDARKALNDAFVPQANRFLAVGSSFEAALLKSEHLNTFNQAGDNTAFRDAVIGRIAGFTAVTAPGLDPDTAIAGHQTAFALSMRAPVVPDGVVWGTSESYAGLSMRAIRDYDFDNIRDRLLANVYVGVGAVLDTGTIGGDGKFVPAADPEDSGVDAMLIRAVRMTIGS